MRLECRELLLLLVLNEATNLRELLLIARGDCCRAVEPKVALPHYHVLPVVQPLRSLIDAAGQTCVNRSG